MLICCHFFPFTLDVFVPSCYIHHCNKKKLLCVAEEQSIIEKGDASGKKDVSSRKK